MGYPILPFIYKLMNFILGCARINDMEFHKFTGTLIGDDNTGQAGSVLFPTHKHSTKIQNFRASPKLDLKTLLQIPVGQVYEKILKKVIKSGKFPSFSTFSAVAFFFVRSVRKQVFHF